MENERFNLFCSTALNALISKIPLQDQKGEIGKHITDDDMVQLKKDICHSAYMYAKFMVDCIEENKRNYISENYTISYNKLNKEELCEK